MYVYWNATLLSNKCFNLIIYLLFNEDNIYSHISDDAYSFDITLNTHNYIVCTGKVQTVLLL